MVRCYAPFQSETLHSLGIVRLILLQLLGRKHIIGTKPYLVFLRLVLPLPFLSFLFGFPSFARDNRDDRGVNMGRFLVCVECGSDHVVRPESGAKPIHRFITPLVQAPFLLYASHILW